MLTRGFAGEPISKETSHENPAAIRPAVNDPDLGKPNLCPAGVRPGKSR